MSILNIAKLVKVVENEFSDVNEISIIRTESDDNRSYHINSDKIKVLNLKQSLVLKMQ